MATAMSYTSSGGEHRRCDATCHTAKKPTCSCICGGRLHGCGSSQAAIEKNTEDWLGKDWKEKNLTPDQIASVFKAAMGDAVAAIRLSPTGKARVAMPETRPVRFEQAGGAA